jgi:hypothetical protein
VDGVIGEQRNRTEKVVLGRAVEGHGLKNEKTNEFCSSGGGNITNWGLHDPGCGVNFANARKKHGGKHLSSRPSQLVGVCRIFKELLLPYQKTKNQPKKADFSNVSGRRDLNPQPSPWQ